MTLEWYDALQSLYGPYGHAQLLSMLFERTWCHLLLVLHSNRSNSLSLHRTRVLESRLDGYLNFEVNLVVSATIRWSFDLECPLGNLCQVDSEFCYPEHILLPINTWICCLLSYSYLFSTASRCLVWVGSYETNFCNPLLGKPEATMEMQHCMRSLGGSREILALDEQPWCLTSSSLDASIFADIRISFHMLSFHEPTVHRGAVVPATLASFHNPCPRIFCLQTFGSSTSGHGRPAAVL